MAQSLRDILPPTKRMEQQEPAGITPGGVPPQNRVPIHRIHKRKRFPYGILIAAIVVVLLSVVATFVLGTSNITITPDVESTYVSTEFAGTLKEGDIPFELITVEKKASKSVPAEGTERVDAFAEGEITISNTSKDSQPLIKNTRFQSSEGYIYRIRDSITVPSGTSEKPGVIKVRVYSSEPGPEYNIKPGTFTIPGLEGSAIVPFLRSVSSEAFTGGFSGERPTVTEATKDNVVATLQAALLESVEADLRKDVPADYAFIKGGATTTFTVLPNASGGAGTASVEVVARTTALVFANEPLAKAIASKTINNYAGEPIRIVDPSTLTLVGGSIDNSMTSYAFILSGQVEMKYSFKEDSVRSVLAGKSISAGRIILNEMAGIKEFSLSLRPFFRADFPTKEADFDIIIKQ